MVLQYYSKLGKRFLLDMHSLSEDLIWDFIQLSFVWSDGSKFQWDFDKLTTVGLDTRLIKHKTTWCYRYVLKAYSF